MRAQFLLVGCLLAALCIDVRGQACREVTIDLTTGWCAGKTIENHRICDIAGMQDTLTAQWNALDLNPLAPMPKSCSDQWKLVCGIMGGIPRPDACSKFRFCRKDFISAPQCTRDEQCNGKSIQELLVPQGLVLPCCWSLRNNVDAVCDGVTQQFRDNNINPFLGICTDNDDCWQTAGASTLSVSAVLVAASTLVAAVFAM